MKLRRCRACGSTWDQADAAARGQKHVCGRPENPGYQPDPSAPRYDPRPALELAGHRDERVFATITHDPEGRPMKVDRHPPREGAGVEDFETED